MIPIAGTIAGAVKYQAMNGKWMQKKNSDHVLTKEELNERENWTQEEMDYLESHNPEALKKYKEIRAEKKSYEQKLKKCKTKEEVQKLKTDTMGQYLSSLKSVVNNPVIPKSEKLAKAQEMLAKANCVEDAHSKFIQSARYQNLQTESEKTEEEETKKKSQDAKDQTEEDTVSTEPDDLQGILDVLQQLETQTQTGDTGEEKGQTINVRI